MTIKYSFLFLGETYNLCLVHFQFKVPGDYGLEQVSWPWEYRVKYIYIYMQQYILFITENKRKIQMR